VLRNVNSSVLNQKIGVIRTAGCKKCRTEGCDYNICTRDEGRKNQRNKGERNRRGGADWNRGSCFWSQEPRGAGRVRKTDKHKRWTVGGVAGTRRSYVSGLLRILIFWKRENLRRCKAHNVCALCMPGASKAPTSKKWHYSGKSTVGLFGKEDRVTTTTGRREKRQPK